MRVGVGGCGWVSPRLKKLQRTWWQRFEGPPVGRGRAMNQGCSEPFALFAGPVSRSSPHPWRGQRRARAGRALGSGARQTAARPSPVPPLGLPGEAARGLQRVPAAEGRPPSLPAPDSGPAAASAAPSGAGAGGAAQPRPALGARGAPASGRVAARSPPHPPPGLNAPPPAPAAAAWPSPPRARRPPTCSSRGPARRLRSAAAPPRRPAGSGESAGLGVLRGGRPPADQATALSRAAPLLCPPSPRSALPTSVGPCPS